MNKISSQYSKEKKSIEKAYRRNPVKPAKMVLQEEMVLHEKSVAKSRESRLRSRYRSKSSGFGRKGLIGREQEI